MVTRVTTVAFEGIEARRVDVQVQISAGLPALTIVGLPDKAVAESRERVRAALTAIGLALPPKRITINLAPADLPKEGSHYDLPIALCLMAAMGAFDGVALQGFTVLGELALDATVSRVAGVLPAAIAANAQGHGLICPGESGPEAAWADPDLDIVAAPDLLTLVNHLSGTAILSRPRPALAGQDKSVPDMRDIRGQETAKRALEIAAAGGHNLLMIARANHRVRYPARFQLVAAMNPCRCGMAGEPGQTCKRGERCAADYQARISGPLLDRIDIHLDIPAIMASDLMQPPSGEASADIAKRVAAARERQGTRYVAAGLPAQTTNAVCPANLIDELMRPQPDAMALLGQAAEAMRLSARGFHRVLRVGRTLADLDGAEMIGRSHIAEALAYRARSDRHELAA